MDEKTVINNIYKAFNKLLADDQYLLKADANERSITHKLAEYLQAEFSDWNVDCEYNRDGMDIKRLMSFKKYITSDDTEATSVFPDIIIHNRGTNDNLVVIEAKKSTNTVDNDNDKLHAYKHELNYKFAIKIKLPVGDSIKNITDISEYIEFI